MNNNTNEVFRTKIW